MRNKSGYVEFNFPHLEGKLGEVAADSDEGEVTRQADALWTDSLILGNQNELRKLKFQVQEQRAKSKLGVMYCGHRGLPADYFGATNVSVEENVVSVFRRLAEEWKKTKRSSSSVAERAMTLPYQQIIGLGSAALPLIIEELKVESDHWFWALKAISREDPVPAPDRGDVERMRQHWIAWWESKKDGGLREYLRSVSGVGRIRL